MGKIWDSLFNREYLDKVEDSYKMLSSPAYSYGLREFLKRTHREDDGSYNIKCYIYENKNSIFTIQHNYNIELERIRKKQQQIIDCCRHIQAIHPRGYEYYCMANSLVPYEWVRPEDIIYNADIIRKKQDYISYLDKINKELPDVFSSVNRALGYIISSPSILDFSARLGKNEFKFAEVLRENEEMLQKHIEYHQTIKQYPEGIRLFLGGRYIVLGLRYILQDFHDVHSDIDRIKELDEKFKDLMNLKCEYPVLFDRLKYILNPDIRKVFRNCTAEDIDKLYIIKNTILELKEQLQNGIGLSEIQKEILRRMPHESQMQYLFNRKLEGIIDPSPLHNPTNVHDLVPLLLKECNIINLSCVTFKQYCETKHILYENYSNITRSIETLEQYSRSISKAYSLSETDKLPFNALTDIYLSDKIKQCIDDENKYIELKDKAAAIANKYPKAYKYFVENRTVDDIQGSESVTVQVLKWIIDNETLLASEQKNQDNQEREERDAIDKAHYIFNNYFKGFNYYVNLGRIKDLNSCTSMQDYQNIIRYGKECQIKHEDIYHREKKQQLMDCVAHWHVTHLGFHHDYLYDYLKAEVTRQATEKEWEIRNLIWAFKNDPQKLNARYSHSYAMNILLPDIKKRLIKTFSYHLQDLTLVCLPASNTQKNKLRWEVFSYILCKDLRMENGYRHITVTKPAIPRHEGGDGIPGLDIDADFFRDKNVLLFDDIKTTGKFIARIKSMLESAGATVICAFTVGKTVHE